MKATLLLLAVGLYACSAKVAGTAKSIELPHHTDDSPSSGDGDGDDGPDDVGGDGDTGLDAGTPSLDRDAGAHARGDADAAQTFDAGATGGVSFPLLAGFRASSYGPREWAQAHNTTFAPDAQYWTRVADSMADRFEQAAPGGVYIVGELNTMDDGVNLKFPGASTPPASVHFADADLVESALTMFDQQEIEVWLQVESGNADMLTLIDLVLSRYQQHPSVIGFGVDVEWYQESTHKGEGKEVSDEEASAWLERVQSYSSDYTLLLKHWQTEKMPPTVRDGLIFINDGQGVDSLATLLTFFSQWGQHFAGHPVGFQIGYETDQKWWSTLDDPAKQVGQAVLQAVPNARGLFWVDFTIADVVAP
jgi:hypothetical protein